MLKETIFETEVRRMPLGFLHTRYYRSLTDPD